MRNELKQLRETLGLTQKDLAVRIGSSVQFISSFERGMTPSRDKCRNSVSYEYIGAIERFLEEHNVKMSEPQPIPQNATLTVGKQGKHHCFKETSGGWSRTYTDQQLIGKTIQEVINEG